MYYLIRIRWFNAFEVNYFPFRSCHSANGFNPKIAKAVQQIEYNHVYHRQVNICKRFAKNFFLLRPWFLRYIPKNGYPITINYIDTDPDNQSKKTILLLHNTPGSYYDYFRLIADFGRNYRIIAPNFPDFFHTLKTGCFWHSAEEKSEFIFDFLKDLNVKDIHCLITHSLSVYTASYIWLYSNEINYPNLHSICLLNPIGISKFSLKERMKMNLLSHASRSLILRKLTPQKWINVRRSPAQNIFARHETAFLIALTKNLSNYQNYELRLKTLSRLQIPSLFVFSSNDKLFPSFVYFEQLYHLAVDFDDFDVYEQYENNLIQTSDQRSWIKVVDFRAGGHYIHKTHPYLIHSYIDELLNIDKSNLIHQTNLIEDN